MSSSKLTDLCKKCIGINSTVPRSIRWLGSGLVARNKFRVRTKSPVYPPYELVYDSSEVLVLLDILPTWDSNLNQYNLSNPLRMVG